LQVCYSSAAHRTLVQRHWRVTTHGKDFNDQQWKLNLCRIVADNKISASLSLLFRSRHRTDNNYEMWPQIYISTISSHKYQRRYLYRSKDRQFWTKTFDQSKTYPGLYRNSHLNIS
jgi:hypothetical protein